MTKKIDKLFKKSKQVLINDQSKIVIMSDCHRGIRDINDNFKKNKKTMIFHNKFAIIIINRYGDML